MKIHLILSLLISGAVGSKVINNNIINNREPEVVVQDNKKNSDMLTAYVDGENKVYLNDINDSNVVEDSWKNTETKTLSLNLDFTKLDPNERYFEIELPLGMELKISPESIVDGRNIIGVDKSEFKQVNFNVSGAIDYLPNQGRLIYEVSSNANVLNLDLLVSIDNKLWDTQSEYACKDNGLAIIVSVGDSSNVVSKKIDNIRIIPNVSSPSYGTDHGHISGSILQNHDTNFNRWFYTNNNSLMKETIIEMEIPYVKEYIGGKVSKKYLDVNTLRLEPAGSYQIVDNVIICKWENVSSSLKRIIFDVYANKESFNHGEEVYITFKNMRFKGMLSENYYSIYDDATFKVSNILSNEEEFLEMGGANRALYIGQESVNIIAHTILRNQGKETNNKKITYTFPKDTIGVKGIRIPTSYYSNSYDISTILWNSITDEEYLAEFSFEKKPNDESSILLKVSDIIEKAGLNIADDNIYIKYIEYDLGRLRTKYDSGFNWVYGKSLTDDKSKKFNMKFSIEDIGDLNIETKTVNTSVTFTSYPKINSRAFANVYDIKNNQITEIESGDTVWIKGEYSGSSEYTMNGTATTTTPVIYLKVPKGIIPKKDSIEILHKDDNNIKRVLNYEIENIDNPRVFNDGNLGYTIKIKDPKLIGPFDDDLKNNGTLLFTIPMSISKNFKTSRLDFLKFVYIGDEQLPSGDTKDINDFDNDGDKEETITSIGSKMLSVISSSNWLNTDSYIEISGESQSSAYLTVNSDEDVVKYSIGVDNSNEGYVRPGNFEYYIPIPKKELEYNTNIKDEDEVFNFNMVLNEKVADITGFEITYSYDNINFVPYSTGLDLSKISMVKIVNTEDINSNDQLQFSVKMNYEEGSWDGSSGNDVVWSAYGNQVYEKNGGESGYLHVMDKIKLEIVKAPIIKENLVQVTANVNDRVSLDAVIYLGIPHADMNWQYRVNSTAPWIDLTETSETLTLENIDYSMNGYQYRYEALNKGGSVTSNIATLIVIDNSAPIIKLTEIRDGENYKIRIDVTDEDNGVSHIILPDGTRIDGDTYTIDAEPNVKYVFKAYDLAGNESIADMTIVNGLAPGRVTSNLDIYIKSENVLSLSLNSNSISFEDFNGTEDLEKSGTIELSINSSLPYEINAYLEEEIQNADKSETMDKSILNLKESSDTDYKEFVDIKTKLNLVSHNDAGNNKLHTFDFKLNGGIAHKKDVYKATIKFEVKQK